MSPFFSVIVPVYNVAPYLARCIDSILPQADDSTQILLIDDGSTDGSGALCDAYGDVHPQVHVIHKENGGLASARNCGMQNATGEWLCFVDADDYVEPSLFDLLAETIRAHAVDVVAFGHIEEKENAAPVFKKPPFEQGHYDAERVRTILFPEMIGPAALFQYGKAPVRSVWAHAYRRTLVTGHGLYFLSERDILHEDYLFNAEVFLRAESVYILHEPLYHYILRSGSLTKQYRINAYGRKTTLYGLFKQLLVEAGLSETLSVHLDNFLIDGAYDCIINERRDNVLHTRKVSVANVQKILDNEMLRTCLRRTGGQPLSPRARLTVSLMQGRRARWMLSLYELGVWTKRMLGRVSGKGVKK